MGKAKQRQLLAVAVNKSKTRSVPEVDLPEEDGWVVVKKQRVTILVPPLHVTKQSTMTNPGPESSLLQAGPTMKTTSIGMHRSEEMDACVQSLDDTEKGVPTARKVPSQPVSTCAKVSSINHGVVSQKPDEAVLFRRPNTLGVCSLSKVSKRSLTFLDQSLLLRQRMRASNLERKLRRAGGLSRWLASLGLNQFVKIFQGRSVSKFQLVNLTMKKLKDMGADAVGPRRKLMHAIDCLCQPYCFETS